MKTTNKLFCALLLMSMTIGFVSCKEEDESEELNMEFKTSEGYTYADETLPGGTEVKIGVEAETEKAKDPLIKFNISESVNGGANSPVYTEDLDDVEFEHDYTFTLSEESGSTHKYTFTVTNRDGINIQKSLTITVE